MARPNKIWWYAARSRWYVTINGKKINLGEDQQEAERKYHKLMLAEDETEIVAVTATPDSVAQLGKSFILWCEENRAARTTRRYKELLQPFMKQFGALLALDLNPSQVSRWMLSQKTWNSTTKCNFLTAIKRMYNWAMQDLGYEKNPVSRLTKPKPQTRALKADRNLRLSQIVRYVRNQNFRDLITFSWDVGCRPQEAKGVLASQIDWENNRVIISAEEGAKGGFTRAIYITNRAAMILSRLQAKHPTGKVFRNTRGNAWTSGAVKCTFRRMASSNAEEIAKAKKDGEDPPPEVQLCQYDFRHLWITRKLREGLDSHVVAKLAGHKDTKMIDRVYSHIQDDPEFMLEQLRKKS